MMNPSSKPFQALLLRHMDLLLQRPRSSLTSLSYSSLSSLLSRPLALHLQCLRSAALYAAIALYEFHARKKSQHEEEHNAVELLWEQALPLLDQHFLCQVPSHHYQHFLDQILCALAILGHYSSIGRELSQYILLFLPPSARVFRVHPVLSQEARILRTTVCCLNRCTAMRELYLDQANADDSVTPYLLAHVLKSMSHLGVLALPGQCDDDVLSILGINCTQLECLVLKPSQKVTNVGLSWLLCCRRLHTIIMPGLFQGISPKGVALLLTGLPSLRHLIYDVMSDVFSYVDFNTCVALTRSFALKTILFTSMELLSSNHLELVTKLCPDTESIALDSALFFNLEGLGQLPQLRFLKLNYKCYPLDSTVIKFFPLVSDTLVVLHLMEVKDMRLSDLKQTIGHCGRLETLVLLDCSIVAETLTPNSNDVSDNSLRRSESCISESVERLQIVALTPSDCLVDLVSLFLRLRILELDTCELNVSELMELISVQSGLDTFRCARWGHADAEVLNKLRRRFPQLELQLNSRVFYDDEDQRATSITLQLLNDYANFGPTLAPDFFYV